MQKVGARYTAEAIQAENNYKSDLCAHNPGISQFATLVLELLGYSVMETCRHKKR